jgi:hypothetical protein
LANPVPEVVEVLVDVGEVRCKLAELLLHWLPLLDAVRGIRTALLMADKESIREL